MKPLVVLVHGWGMPAEFFAPLIAQLSDKVEIVCVKLPGDVGCQYQGETTLKEYTDVVISQVSRQAIWLGWSMGGLICLQVAWQQPALVKSLVLTAATPKFVKDATWQHGVEAQILNNFATAFEQNYSKTLNQFIALQSMFMDKQLAFISQLKKVRYKKPEPCALQAQLELLAKTDMREKLELIPQRAIWFMGKNDALVPTGAGIYAATAMPAGEGVLLDKSGHLPFWTHSKLIADRILTWT